MKTNDLFRKVMREAREVDSRFDSDEYVRVTIGPDDSDEQHEFFLTLEYYGLDFEPDVQIDGNLGIHEGSISGPEGAINAWMKNEGKAYLSR
jgi:hypothetical protein